MVLCLLSNDEYTVSRNSKIASAVFNFFAEEKLIYEGNKNMFSTQLKRVNKCEHERDEIVKKANGQIFAGR